MTDRAREPPFVSDDPDLLEPSPCFGRYGEYIDPALQGYAVVHNYAAYFWRPYLGNTAFALWELLVSFCYGERDVAFPSISRLARMLTNSDHSRSVVTGRRRPPSTKHGGPPAQRRSAGALDVLRRERLVQVRRRGRGPTARYTFRVLKTLPLLRPEQMASLSPSLRYDHANWLERHGIDDATYRQAYETARTATHCKTDAPSTTPADHAFAPAADGTLTPAAPGTEAAADDRRALVADSTNKIYQDNQMEKWWQDTLDSLRLELLRSTFQQCLLGSYPVALEDGELTVCAVGPLQREMLTRRLAPVVLRAVAQASEGQVRSVRIVVPQCSEATTCAP